MRGVAPGGARETPTLHRPGRARVSDGLSVTRQLIVLRPAEHHSGLDTAKNKQTSLRLFQNQRMTRTAGLFASLPVRGAPLVCRGVERPVLALCICCKKMMFAVQCVGSALRVSLKLFTDCLALTLS